MNIILAIAYIIVGLTLVIGSIIYVFGVTILICCGIFLIGIFLIAAGINWYYKWKDDNKPIKITTKFGEKYKNEQ